MRVLARSVLGLVASIAGGLAGLLLGFVLAGLVVVGDLTQAAVEIGGVTWFEGDSSGSELALNPARGVAGVVVVVLLSALGAGAAAWVVTGRSLGRPGLIAALLGALPGAAVVLLDATLGMTVLLVGPPVALSVLRLRLGRG